MTEENKGHGFLTGVIVGGVIGTVITLWLVERASQRGQLGLGRGGSVGELASSIKDDVIGKVKELINRTIDEGSETSRKTRSDDNDGLNNEDEE